MVAQEKAGLKQDTVLWAYTRMDNRANPVVSSPIEIKTHWELARGTFTNDRGEEIAYDGRAMVDREIRVHSVMRLGALEDLPDEPDELYEVISFDSTPDVKGRKFQRNVILKRFKSGALSLDS